jgi:orotate phosphoribosyltransferase
MIRAAGATPCAVLIALDRMERSGKDGALSEHSAVQEVSQEFGMPVISIGNLNDLFAYISAADADSTQAQFKDAVTAYRHRYGTE